MARKRKSRRRDELELAILGVMRNGGKKRHRFTQPWTVQDLMSRASVAHVVGTQNDRVELALARLEDRGEVRRTEGLPITYTLEP